MRLVTIGSLFAFAILASSIMGQAIEARPDSNVSTQRRPVFFKRSELTDAQVAQIEEEREINNLNILIDRPSPGEEMRVGILRSIDCADGRINFNFSLGGDRVSLLADRFDEVRFSVLTAGTRAFTFRCDSRFLSERFAVIFRPKANRSNADGILVSLTVVPSNFRLKSLEQLATEPRIIIEGMPTTSVDGNEQAAAAERAEMERIMSDAAARDLVERSPPPKPERP